MRHKISLLVVCVALFAGWAGSISAYEDGLNSAESQTTRLVCPITSVCAYQTVAAAMADAVDGDIIRVTWFVHTEANVVIDKDVTIQGSLNNAWQAAAAPESGTGRLMHIPAGTTVTIEDIVLRYGDTTEDGGAILNEGSLTLRNVQAWGNSADHGGAIASETNGSQLHIENSTLRENSADRGGALYSNISTTTITNTEILTNNANLGGGIYQNFGTVTLENSILRNNDADSTGGAADVNAGSFTLRNSTATTNYADSGGGLFTYSGNLFVIGSTVTDNRTRYEGAGIRVGTFGELSVLDGSKITENIASFSSGGGIYHTGEDLLISKSKVLSNRTNSTTGRGGGIYISGGGDSTIAFSEIGGNLAKTGGGGVFYAGSEPEDVLLIQYSLFWLNDAGANQEGAGFMQFSGANADIVNTTFSSNIGRSQLQLLDGVVTLTHVTVHNGFGGDGLRRDAGTLTLRNSIVAGHPFGAECDGTITIPAGVANLASDSSCGTSIVNSEHGLEPLGDNAGDTQTHWLADDSPALNAATTAVCNEELVNGRDQRYYLRPHGAACDLGAVERTVSVPTAVGLGAVSAEIQTPAVISVFLLLLTITGIHSRGVPKSLFMNPN